MKIYRCPRCASNEIFHDTVMNKSLCDGCQFHGKIQEFMIHPSKAEIAFAVEEVGKQIFSILNIEAQKLLPAGLPNCDGNRYLFKGRIIQGLFQAHFNLSYQESEKTLEKVEKEINNANNN